MSKETKCKHRASGKNTLADLYYSSRAREAYLNAFSFFESHLDAGELKSVSELVTLEDVMTLLLSCTELYYQRKQHKAQRRFGRWGHLIRVIHHYDGVISMAVQQHAQFSCLVWACFKFLIQASVIASQLDKR